MKRFVTVTVLETQGSVPRDSGTQMLIANDKTLGTIGGGTLEYQVMQKARGLLRSDKPAGFQQTESYVLGTEMGQCCGGQASIRYELTEDAARWVDPLQTTREQFNIVLFGAGHVGQAIISILATQPCQVHWVDSRRELFPAELPANVIRHTPDAPASLVQDMPADSYYLVMTHDHALDLELCDHVLARQDVQFLGLIGSATKAARFRAQLSKRGLTPHDINRLTCPIGIGGIESKLPSSIAVAVVAQLLSLNEKHLEATPPQPSPYQGREFSLSSQHKLNNLHKKTLPGKHVSCGKDFHKQTSKIKLQQKSTPLQRKTALNNGTTKCPPLIRGGLGRGLAFDPFLQTQDQTP